MQTSHYIHVERVYKAYIVPAALREHLYRTAAVGRYIASRLNNVETDRITEAMLLHDIGNIIKFNLHTLTNLLQPHDVSFWKKVQQSFVDRYGNDEHTAHLRIAKELGVNEEVRSCIDAVGFAQLCDHVRSNRWEKKICSYSDLRVSPYGITTLEERLEEGKKRYHIREEDERHDLVSCAFQLEEEIFGFLAIEPNELTSASIASEYEVVKDWKLPISGLTSPFPHFYKKMFDNS